MSSEEPFNYIEHKIKEAAENHHMIFEESSWKKMEALLDKEPRRKPFIWFWLFLPLAIAGGFGIFMLLNKLPKEKINTASFIKVADNKPSKINSKKSVTNSTLLTNANNNPADLNVSFKKAKSTNKIHIQTPLTSKENITQNKNVFTNKAIIDVIVSGGNPSEDNILLNNAKVVNADSTKNITKKDTVQKSTNDSVGIVLRNKEETKKKQSFKSKFYLLGGLGADVSSTKLLAFKNNPVSTKYGLGIGFKIKKNISVQTGFYAGKKKYLAGKGDYNFKTGSYYNMVKVTKVDADCIVYEIPVSIRYNVLQKKSINIYTGLGLSSYIMKKEDYNVYFIKNNREYSWAYQYKGNKAFLSTLILSVGAEKKLTNKIYLQIEPSLSMPLKGVGEGSVKIFSTAFQFGIKYTPF